MKIEPGIYKHHKGRNYEVIGWAINTETREELVVYKALYELPEFDNDTPFFVRPLTMFIEEVEKDGDRIPRFQKI